MPSIDQDSGTSGIATTAAPPAIALCRASHPEVLPITSRMTARRWLSTVSRIFRIASTTLLSAVS
jgi:hypothetical protein